MEEMNDLRDIPPEPGTAEAPRTVPENPELPAGGVGYLIVRVTTALGSIPLEGISVTVRNYNPEGESGKGAVITTLVTDRSGNTKRFPLAAPPKELSEHPGNVRPFASYSVDINTDGYYEQYYTNVPIFDGVTSLQQADLVPLAENRRTDSQTPDVRIFTESQKPSL